MYKPTRSFLTCMVVYCVLIKILPFALVHAGMDIRLVSGYPWSFTPLFAFGLFGIANFRNLRLAYAIPVLICLVSDILIGVFTGMKFGADEGFAYAYYQGQFFQYAALCACISCGFLVRSYRNWGTILTTALLGPMVFFAVSNFGVWLLDRNMGYVLDLAGLMECYAAGLPFIKTQLISTVAFSGLLFSPLGMQTLLHPADAPAAVKPLASAVRK